MASVTFLGELVRTTYDVLLENKYSMLLLLLCLELESLFDLVRRLPVESQDRW